MKRLKVKQLKRTEVLWDVLEGALQENMPELLEPDWHVKHHPRMTFETTFRERYICFKAHDDGWVSFLRGITLDGADCTSPVHLDDAIEALREKMVEDANEQISEGEAFLEEFGDNE